MGSDILAQTRQSVVAGPYHRNNHGNRLLIDAMIASSNAKDVFIGPLGPLHKDSYRRGTQFAGIPLPMKSNQEPGEGRRGHEDKEGREAAASPYTAPLLQQPALKADMDSFAP